MRLLASLAAAAVLATPAFTTPASAVEITVRVPILKCEVTVHTSDVVVNVSRDRVHVTYSRWGDTGARSNC